MPTLAKLVADIKNPITLLAFGILCIVTLLRGPRQPKETTQKILLFGLVCISLLATAPLAAGLFKSRAGDIPIYRLRVLTLDSRHLPVSESRVRVNSLNETHTTTDGSCELVIPRATLNADRRITLFADSDDEHGTETVTLDSDPNPAVTILLTQDKSAGILGRVEDDKGHPLSGVEVSTPGVPLVVTDQSGGFSLPTFTAPDAHISLHLESRGYLPTDIEVRASKYPTLIRLQRSQSSESSRNAR